MKDNKKNDSLGQKISINVKIFLEALSTEKIRRKRISFWMRKMTFKIAKKRKKIVKN